MKHERERKREGEITHTADTSKHSRKTQQRKQHSTDRGAVELNMLQDYAVGLHDIVTLLTDVF